MKIKYIPFLKLKSNEVAALKELDPAIRSATVPFFDIAKKNGTTSETLKSTITKNAQKVRLNLIDFHEMYVDSFDIDDSLLIDDDHNYNHLIEEFKDINFIPVLGLDRTSRRNSLVFHGKRTGKIQSDRVAIRLQADDFEDFRLSKDNIEDLISEGNGLFSEWDFVLDNRLCLRLDILKRVQEISGFIKSANRYFDIGRIIITGSSLTASIGEIIPTEEDLHHPRVELKIFSMIQKTLTDIELVLGDYTVVSPLYSDLNIPAGAMRKVTTAKITYSYENMHYISRGGSLQSHPRGDLQYNDIAQEIIKMPFYRGIPYSFGDRYLDEKANFIGKKVTAGSILKPTINLHITYMVRNYPS